VGITLGSSGTDVSVTGSPITTSGNITINFPTASATNRGLLSSADWTTFNDKQPAGNYVTLDTAQTITAQKVFTTSGSSDTMIISHGSGSGFALDVIKAGNGEVVRVNKTSGSGNAMSIIGGNFGAEDATFSGTLSTTPDAVINGVNVGKGGGSVATNVRVGNQTLTFNTTGSSNTSVGFSSLYFNTTGSLNTSIGTGSLQANTTGGSNTSVGVNSLLINTSGTQNTSTGASALFSNTIGNSNTAVGLQSSYNNTTGNVNVAVGLNSLFGNTTGTSNTALGHGAGHYITNDAAENSISNNSVFVGSQTKAQANNQTNQIVIGHNAIGNGSNTVTIGNDSITSTFLKGNINLKGANNTTKAIEFANSAGLIHWTIQNPFGAAGEQGNFQIRNNVLGSLALNISPSSNIITLTGALNGTSAIFTGSITSYDTLVSRTLTNTTPTLLLSRNNADNGFGVIRVLDGGTISFENGPTGATQTSRLSLDGTTGAATLTGALNGTSASFTGAITLSNNQNAGTLISIVNTTAGSGSQSTFRALSDSTAGEITIGKYSSSTTPYKIIGSGSGFVYTDKGNISILNDNTSGSILLAAGGSSTAHLTLASTGAATFSSSVSGSQFIANGSSGGGFEGLRIINASTGAAQIVLNNSAQSWLINTRTDNQFSIFNATTSTTPFIITTAGNVGIGTDSPGRKLAVVSGTNTPLFTHNTNNVSGVFGYISQLGGNNTNDTSSYYLYCDTDAIGVRLVIYGNGNVANVNNSYGAYSDIKLKENIQDASPKLQDLLKVKVRNYNLIGEDTKQIGVIAQELEEVFPAMIDESEDFEELEVPQLDEEGNEVLNEEGEVVTTKERVSKGTTTKSVKYSVFVPMLIKAIQEQQEIINEMRSEIDSLKNQIK
jgi:hypothetical protein